MNFAGLPFAQVLTVFGVAAALATTLYILKLRRRTVAVPFAPLWKRVLQEKEATSLFSKLKRLMSLLLQLVLLALLAIALGDPRAAQSFVKGRTLVVLMDASASMQATDGAPTRLDSAKNEVKALVRGLGASDRMLIAQMDTVTVPLGPMSSDTSELERAVDGVKPTEARADFARGLRFAADALRGLDEPEIVVVSDGVLGEAQDAFGLVHVADAKLSFIPVGKAARNVAITQFSVRRYPLDKNRYEVMLEVTNTGPETEDVELSLLGDGAVVDLTKLRLKPNERLPRFYPNLSGASRSLDAVLKPLADSVDVLPADNHAYALLPERRRARVLTVSAGNTYLEAALLLDEYLDVELVAPRDYPKRRGEKFDVVIFDGVTPVEAPRAHAIYLDPRGDGSPVKVEGEIASPGFDKIERKHPLVRFTALDDVNIARAHKLVPATGDRVVASANAGALLIAGTRGGFKFVALGFDPRDSDLPLRIAFPLLLINAINDFTGEDANYLSSFRTGEVWRIPVAGDTQAVKLSGPGGLSSQLPVHEGRAVIQGTRSGFYEVETVAQAASPSLSATDTASPQAPTPTKVQFAANLLDVTESTLTPQRELKVDGKLAGRVSAFHIGVRREVWIYLLLAVALIAVIEWATYHRRLTV
jgi:von Willebrand factor type A domain/Aerotolerance regulator N-terminal